MSLVAGCFIVALSRAMTVYPCSQDLKDFVMSGFKYRAIIKDFGTKKLRAFLKR
jgi:hypothetical protein